MLQLRSRPGHLLVLVIVLTASAASFAETSAQVLATRLANRIGTYVPPAVVTQMTSLISAAQSGSNSNGFVQAAALVTGTPGTAGTPSSGAQVGYGDVFLFNLMAPMCSLANSINVAQNPCISTLQYIAWNNNPWTDALTGTYVGVFATPAPAPATPVTLPAASLANWTPASTTDHWTTAYNDFQAGKMSYVQYLTSVSQASLYPTGTIAGTDGAYAVTATAPTDIAGILTLPQVAYDTANMGTNRRYIEFLFQNMLASPLQAIRDASFGTSSAFDGIRKDVQALAPDTATLTGTCATCHGGIDRMAAAFNLMDYTNTTGGDNVLTQNSAATGLATKLAARETEYANEPGYVESQNSPAINSWTINYKNSPYGAYAWGATTGTGIAQLAKAAIATDEFRVNLINNIWTLACGGAPTAAENSTVVSLAKQMRLTFQDNVTLMVQQVATLPQCLGR